MAKKFYLKIHNRDKRPSLSRQLTQQTECVFSQKYKKRNDLAGSKAETGGNAVNVFVANIVIRSSSCGSVGRAVASYTRGPWFESSHRQILLNQYFMLTV